MCQEQRPIKNKDSKKQLDYSSVNKQACQRGSAKDLKVAQSSKSTTLILSKSNQVEIVVDQIMNAQIAPKYLKAIAALDHSRNLSLKA